MSPETGNPSAHDDEKSLCQSQIFFIPNKFATISKNVSLCHYEYDPIEN